VYATVQIGLRAVKDAVVLCYTGSEMSYAVFSTPLLKDCGEVSGRFILGENNRALELVGIYDGSKENRLKGIA
jgi:hypothetical protein